MMDMTAMICLDHIVNAYQLIMAEIATHDSTTVAVTRNAILPSVCTMDGTVTPDVM